MKKWVISLLMLLCLTGCSPNAEIERGMTVRTSLLQADGCSFDVQILADYGDKSYEFSEGCSFDSQGNMSFTVKAPQSIEGIAGTVNSTEGKLTFEDTALYFDPMTDDQVSPVTAPWILVKTLRSGNLTSACEEDSFLRLTLEDSFAENPLLVDVWLDSANQPVRGEILYDGRRILSLNVVNFRIV